MHLGEQTPPETMHIFKNIFLCSDYLINMKEDQLFWTEWTVECTICTECTFDMVDGPRVLNYCCSDKVSQLNAMLKKCILHLWFHRSRAMETGVSHLSKTYLRAMKAKASGKVKIRSLGRGKAPSSSCASRSRQWVPGGSQNSSLHSHSFNTASILRGGAGERGG